MAVAHVEHGDAGHEVYIATAVDVPDLRALCFLNNERIFTSIGG
jgi:hypothetical protein